MKSTTVLFTAVSLLTAAALLPAAQAQESKAKKKPAPEKTAADKKAAGTDDKDKKPATPAATEMTKEQSVLKQALENHSQLKGFHVDVVIKTAGGNATLTGALGAGSLSLDGTDVTGAKKKRVVTGGEFYLSDDGGKTWKKGEDADKQSTLLFNNIITAPLQMKEGILKESFTAKEEKLDGEDMLHVEKPAKGESAAVHFWLCKEAALENKIYLRKAQLTVSGTDIEVLATITYSKLSEPVEIKAPDTK